MANNNESEACLIYQMHHEDGGVDLRPTVNDRIYGSQPSVPASISRFGLLSSSGRTLIATLFMSSVVFLVSVSSSGRASTRGVTYAAVPSLGP